MPQVAKRLTPANPAVVLGAMAYAYKKVTGQVPPNFYAILLPTAQSALETAAWRAMWGWNAGNVTSGHPDTDDWMDLGVGLRFKAYKNLGDGCADMMMWLAKHNCLAAAASGDVGVFTQALAASCYAGCPGQPGTADYSAYAAGVYGFAKEFSSVTPTPYGPGLGWLASFGLGLGIVSAAGIAAYAISPRTVAGLLGAGESSGSDEEEENPAGYDVEDVDEEDADADEEDDPSESSSESTESSRDPSSVQTILFPRAMGWNKSKAKAWVRSHPPFHFGKVDVTRKYIRVRQVDPAKFHQGFYTIPFGHSGIKAVIGRR